MGNDSNLAMLVVRSSHFVPVGRGFIEGKDLTVLFIFSENFVICACAGRQMKLPAFRINYSRFQQNPSGRRILSFAPRRWKRNIYKSYPQYYPHYAQRWVDKP